MNLISLISRSKLFSLIFLSLIIVLFILDPTPFTRNSRTYAEENTDSIQNCRSETLFYAAVSVNGDTAVQSITYVKRDQQILIDAHLFFDLVGGQYYPIGQNFGLTIQYGKFISNPCCLHDDRVFSIKPPSFFI